MQAIYINPGTDRENETKGIFSSLMVSGGGSVEALPCSSQRLWLSLKGAA